MLSVLQFADAGQREDFVAVIFYDVMFAIMESSDGNVAQHVVERPHQRLRAGILEILFYRTYHDFIKLLGHRQRITLRREKHAPQREHLFPQHFRLDRIIARDPRVRQNQDNNQSLWGDDRVKRYGAWLEFVKDCLQVTRLLFELPNTCIGLFVLPELLVKFLTQECLEDLFSIAEPLAERLKALLSLWSSRRLDIQRIPFIP